MSRSDREASIVTRPGLVGSVLKPVPRRRGFVLILVLVYVLLAASLLVTTAGSIAQLAGTTRREHVSILLRQLIDSGAVWVERHDELRAHRRKVSLDGADLVPSEASAVVTIIPAPESARENRTITIEARLDMNGRRYVRTVKVEG